MSIPEIISPARLRWRDGQPYSEDFADIYHAPDAAAEVMRVFVEPTQLAHKASRNRDLLVGELGFGTGLNFAVTAELCLRAGARLHFVSFDAAPIDRQAFRELCRERRADHGIYTELSQRYPPLIRGWHRRRLAGGRVTLSLYWGNAAAGLEDIKGRQHRGFDAWYLDGFAPDRNPDMWTPELLADVGTLAGGGCTVATFTAAGRVRRALQAAGFTVRRVDQRPHKRESLAGEHQGSLGPRTRPVAVRVLGSGLAGSAVARHLAERGIAVTVHEAAGAVAAGASAIPATVVHPRLIGDGSVHAALRCHAYLHGTAHYDAMLETPGGGAMQLPATHVDGQRLAAIGERYRPSGEWLGLLSPEAASEHAGWTIESQALWFPDARVVDTPALCARALDHPGIEIRLGDRCTYVGHGPTVLACGAECRSFAQARYLETAPVHGQVDFLRVSPAPAVPLLGNGYLVPWNGTLAAGTTYEHGPWDPDDATRANLEQLADKPQLTLQWLSRARGIRCVSSDRTPIAGRLYSASCEPLEDVYLSTAHGSMGTVFSQFAAALVASQVCGDFAPMSRDLEAALSSERFRVRQARRGFRHGAKG